MSWDVLPEPRSPRVQDHPPREGSRIVHGASTSVFMMIRRLMREWRDDPDKLAIALATWTLAGYPGANAIDEIALGYRREDELLSDDEARDLIERALHRRNKKILRHRAEGVLMCLEELAVDAEEAEHHRLQEDACVIECRELSPDERAERLRGKDALEGYGRRMSEPVA